MRFINGNICDAWRAVVDLKGGLETRVGKFVVTWSPIFYFTLDAEKVKKQKQKKQKEEKGISLI